MNETGVAPSNPRFCICVRISFDSLVVSKSKKWYLLLKYMFYIF